MTPKTLLLLCMLAALIKTSAQDGSDIRYISVQQVDNASIGKFVQLDFYNKSYRNRKRDTISIQVNGTPVNFVEHRVDNGFNNWFDQQYLEALNYPGTGKLRIERFKIKQIKRESIEVTAYFSLHDSKNETISSSLFTDDYWFDKNIIAEVLITDKNFF